MSKASDCSNTTSGRSRVLSKGRAGGVAFTVLIVLVGLRAASEWTMMSEFGSDPQMPIWAMLMAVKLALWLVGGGLVAGLLVVARHKRLGLLSGVVLLLGWAGAICAASWEYQRARHALADASDPSTSPDRLEELVQFDGIQAGYELDNRLAVHPSTPPEALRELYQRDQVGTQISLARNPNTPEDILLEMVNHEEKWVQQSLARNPDLPESVRRKLDQEQPATE